LAGLSDDSNCVIITFWKTRDIALCLDDEKEIASLNAVVSKNFEEVMSNKKFFNLELNKRPFDEYRFVTKLFYNKTLYNYTIYPDKDSIKKGNNEELFK